MKKLFFEITIDAPVEKVTERMLGKETYKEWTFEFHPTSFYEGSWEQGAKITFLGINKEGKREGMLGHIKEHIPYQYIEIEYDGLVNDGNEITEGAAVEGWRGATESYRFETSNGTTTIFVEADTHPDYEEYSNTTWPSALKKLKEICEA